MPGAQGHRPENSMALDLGPGTTWAHCLPSVCPCVKRVLQTYSRGVCEDALSAVAQHTKAGVGSLSPHLAALGVVCQEEAQLRTAVAQVAQKWPS